MLGTTLLVLSSIIGIDLMALPGWPQDHDPKEFISTLNENELKRICKEWDNELEHSKMLQGHSLLTSLYADVPNERYGMLRLIKYDNPEIVQRISDLFLAEYQYNLRENIALLEETNIDNSMDELTRYKVLLELTISDHGNMFAGLPMRNPGRLTQGEIRMDYYDMLAELTHATFNPKLYDEIWNEEFLSNNRKFYLSLIYYRKTLDILLASRSENKYGILKISNGHTLPIYDALDIIGLICEQHNSEIFDMRISILSFLKDNFLIYAEPIGGKYFEIEDFKYRRYALRILKEIGTPNEIELVHRLVHNSPENGPKNMSEDRYIFQTSWEELSQNVVSSINLNRTSP